MKRRAFYLLGFPLVFMLTTLASAEPDLVGNSASDSAIEDVLLPMLQGEFALQGETPRRRRWPMWKSPSAIPTLRWQNGQRGSL